MILSEAILQWLEAYKKTSVKQATYNRLVCSWNLMTKHWIAGIDNQELTSRHVQDYLNFLADNNYAQTTIKKQFHLISAYVRYANAEGIMQRPLYETVSLPAQAAIKKQKKEIVAYTDDEQSRLWSVLKTNSKRGYPAIAFMLETGIRVGEALALQWSDVLWQRKAISINKTLIHMDSNAHALVQHSPKSAASKRIIPLSTEALHILNTIEKNGSYVFNPNDTAPLSYKVLRKNVKAACKAANIPYKGMHVFRHTFATNCYYRGCDVKILSKLLGHSSVTVTYNTYIHLFGDALEEMRAVLL